ncbi:MAG: hypothetical protein ABI947_03655 [Chloroflexota bacterium]
MSRYWPYEGLLLNLKQRIPKEDLAYLTAEEAYKLLKEWTEQDFGYDVTAWEKWLMENKKNAIPKRGQNDTAR